MSELAALESFRAFPFDTDETYKRGLEGILANGALEGKTDEEKAEYLLNTRVFFFNRTTGSNISVSDVRAHASTVSPDAAAPSETASSTHADATEPRTLSFAELKELIEQGKTDQIPNNRLIPNELSKNAPSDSTAPIKKKPWEH